MRKDKPSSRLRYRVLVLFPSVENRAQLLRAVNAAGVIPRLSDSFEEGRRALERGDVDLVICEDRMSREMIAEVFRQASERPRPIPVIVTSRTGEWAEFLSVLQQGAFDYLPLPPRLEEVRRILKLALAEVSETIERPLKQRFEKVASQA